MSKRQTTTIFRRGSPGVVSLGVFGWLSVLILPCTVALSDRNFSTVPTATAAIEVDHTHHHESSEHESVSADHHDGHSVHDGAKALIESNDECHGGHATAGPMESGCCCDVTALNGTDSDKLKQFSTAYAVAVSQQAVIPQHVARVISLHHGRPKQQTSPPVYLSTQRFRI